MSSRSEPLKPLVLVAALASGLTLSVELAGCKSPMGQVQPSTPVTVLPSPSGGSATPTPGGGGYEPPVEPLDGTYSDAGYAIFGGGVQVQVRADGRPLANALVKLYGPTLSVATSDANGGVHFAPLAPGTDYKLVVEAAGQATHFSAPFEVKKKETAQQRVDLRAGATLAGTVTADGKPVAGAVVSDGSSSTLTGVDGRWRLEGVLPGAVTLTASKPRFRTTSKAATAAAGQAATVELALTAGSATVYFDDAIASGLPAERQATLRKQLAERGWSASATPPASEGVWVMVSPQADMPAAELERRANFVAQGGKLVMLGEWGGFGGFRTSAANALVHRFGLHFNPDLLREPAEGRDPAWLAIKRFKSGEPAVGGLASLELYQSCSLFGLAPMDFLAQTGAGGYRVQAAPVPAIQTVAAGGPYKGGKAVIVGDASAFVDDDTDGDGIANAAEADNLRFIERIFDW